MNLMKCKYEGNGIHEDRCMGTKEIDPCIGYERCSAYKPNYMSNGDCIRIMNDDGLTNIFCYFLTSTLRENGVDVVLGDGFKKSFGEWLKQPYKEATNG